MNRFKGLIIGAAVAVVCFTGTAPKVEAQVAIDIGAEPECPYGYYDYVPYSCAPYGYYSPEWFAGGVFVGAGPWFHGPAHFRGHVDGRFDLHHGYRGTIPNRGDGREPSNRVDQIHDFRGDEMHDGHGNVGGGHEGGGAQHDGVLFDRYRNMFVIARRYFNGNGGDIDSARGAVIFSSRQILETAVAFPPLSSQARHG